MKPSTILSFLALALPFASATPRRRHHQEVARHQHAEVNTDVTAVEVDKRDAFTSARFTYYDVGLGACGEYSQPDQMVVALNVPQFGEGYPGPNCFKNISISYGGKSTTAMIVDKCEACPYGGLDFSRGLFSSLAEEALGVLYGDWEFL